MKKLIFFSFFLIVSFQSIAQDKINGSWEGILIDQEGIEQEFLMTITTPEKQQRSTYFVKRLKVWIKLENEEQLQFYGELNHGSTSINLYQNGYENRNKQPKTCFLKLQLVFKNNQYYGYWQDTKIINNNEAVCKLGKVKFKKNNSLKQV